MNSKDTSVHCSHMVYRAVHKALSPPVFGYFKPNTEVWGRSGKSSHVQ